MFVVKTRRNRKDPRAWLWVVGTLVLPMMILVGFGTGVDRALGSQTAATVAVVIHPDRIQMPDSLTAGTITFEVTNRDSVVHGLAVRPVDTEEPVGQLEAPLRPGATAKMQVTLAAGSYRVYSPNAVDRGLMHVVSVVPDASRSEPGSGTQLR
jgi:hypothetical protein